MSETLPLLTVPQAVEAAGALCRRVDDALDARRAITGLSTSAIVSIAILARQLDAIARAAAALPLTLDQAAFTMTADELALLVDLHEQLQAAGYLPPIPDDPPAQEPPHGQG